MFAESVTSITEKHRAEAVFKRRTFHLPSYCDVATSGVTMNFEWHEAKNRANIRKHGFDFAEAEDMFRGVLVGEADTREDYGEKRWRGIGIIRGRMAVVIFTEPTPQTLRIISLRKAHHEERGDYEKAIHDGLGEN
jgi:hypothetical protein